MSSDEKRQNGDNPALISAVIFGLKYGDPAVGERQETTASIGRPAADLTLSGFFVYNSVDKR